MVLTKEDWVDGKEKARSGRDCREATATAGLGGPGQLQWPGAAIIIGTPVYRGRVDMVGPGRSTVIVGVCIRRLRQHCAVPVIPSTG